MGIIIFIHGMGHNPDHEYWQSWGANLQPYLVDQGIDPQTIKFDGIYYYDLVPQPGDGWKKISSFFARDIAEELGRIFRQHLKNGEMLQEMLGRGPVDSLVDFVVDNFGDIFSYLLNDEVYKQVNKRVYDALERAAEPVTLVAYSLGTLISFCALQQRPELTYKLKHFITMGSPIFWFRKWLSRRVDLTRQPTTARWTNLAGRLDIACPHLVSYHGCGPDASVECDLDKFNPIKGHLAYILDPRGLRALAKAVVERW